MNTSPTTNTNENEQNSPTEQLTSEIFSGDTSCWSPRFEFDAPRYTNFNSKKYQETRRRLNKLILGETEGEDGAAEIVNGPDAEISMEMDSKTVPVAAEDSDDDITRSPQLSSSSDSSSEIDEWFGRFHPLHEPLRPMTPPGPLISPERRRLGAGLNCLMASPLKLEMMDSSFTQSPTHSKPAGTFLNTPSKGPNTRIGLRSKPARVLKGGGGMGSSSNSPKTAASMSPKRVDTVRSSVPVQYGTFSPVRSSITAALSPFRSAALSPVRSAALSPVRSPIRSFFPASRTPQHSPSLSSTDSAISLNVSSLTKNGLASPVKKLPSSPLKMKSKYSEGMASPLRNSIQFQPETITRKRPPNATAATSTNPTEDSTKIIRKQPKIDAELEDIKKLLSQHNSRIRPNHHNNNSNKRKS